MKTHFHLWRPRALVLLAALAAWVAAPARLSAADEPAAAAPAPAPAAPAAAPSGSWYVFSPPKEDEVLSASQRLKMLTTAKTFLDRNKPELLTLLQTADNPFYVKQPPPPTPVVAANTSTSTNTGSAQPVAPPTMSDEDKLKAIADKLQPTGMLEGAGKSLVTYDGVGGGTIEVGQPFIVTVPPDQAPISVVIVDANETSCTFKLNATTLPVSYVAKSSAPSHPPSSTTTPTPSKP